MALSPLSSSRPGLRMLVRSIGYLFVGIGALGAVLPILPTTGPWILGVWCLLKGNDPFANRLLNHPRFGKPLRDWFYHGRVTREGKIAATVGMTLSVGIAAVLGMRGVPLLCLGGGLSLVALWLWSRPTGKPMMCPLKQHLPEKAVSAP